MCCSVRDKEGIRARFLNTSQNVPFECVTAQVTLQDPRFLALAPLWQTDEEPPKPRRLALASESKVHIYRVPDTEPVERPGGDNGFDPASLRLEYTLELGAGMVISAVVFNRRGDERKGERNMPMSLFVAACPAEGVSAPNTVKAWIFPTAQSAGFENGAEVTVWTWNQGQVITTQHAARVDHLATSPQYLLTADGTGACSVWDKSKSFTNKGSEKLHDESQGGLSDLVAERHFAYSSGRTDLLVKVWGLPDLRLVMQTSMHPKIRAPLIPESSVQPQPPQSPDSTKPQLEFQGVPCIKLAGQAAEISDGLPCTLAELTGLRRPASRWCGAQASERVRAGAGPRGLLFVAGMLSVTSDIADVAASVLMVLALGKDPECHAIQIAHDTPIAAISYGPYDNGPLVTADACGIFRVWEYAPRLVCLQQGNIGGGAPCHPAIAMDPMERALYSITGNQRLIIWKQRTNNSAEPS